MAALWTVLHVVCALWYLTFTTLGECGLYMCVTSFLAPPLFVCPPNYYWPLSLVDTTGSLVPRLFAGEGKEEPGTHRSRMRLITVTFHGFRILSAYSRIRWRHTLWPHLWSTQCATDRDSATLLKRRSLDRLRPEDGWMLGFCFETGTTCLRYTSLWRTRRISLTANGIRQVFVLRGPTVRDRWQNRP